MYNKKSLIQGLNEILDLIPNDISPENVKKKEQIKKDLEKLKDKTIDNPNQKQREYKRG